MSTRSRSAAFALALGVVVAGASGLVAAPAFADTSGASTISVSLPGTGVDMTDVVDSNGEVQDQSAGSDSSAPEVSITSVPMPGGNLVSFGDSTEVSDPSASPTDPTPQPEPTSSESPEPAPSAEPSEQPEDQSGSDQGSGSQDGNSQGSESSGQHDGSQPSEAPSSPSGDQGGSGGDGSDH